MEEKYYEILRHYVNPNDCATIVKQLLSLHNVSSTLDFDKMRVKFDEILNNFSEQDIDDWLNKKG
jgi:hypothetical protein